jgi:hypothetical protein
MTEVIAADRMSAAPMTKGHDTKVCGFHDHLNRLEDSFRGRIVVED